MSHLPVWALVICRLLNCSLNVFIKFNDLFPWITGFDFYLPSSHLLLLYVSLAGWVRSRISLFGLFSHTLFSSPTSSSNIQLILFFNFFLILLSVPPLLPSCFSPRWLVGSWFPSFLMARRCVHWPFVTPELNQAPLERSRLRRDEWMHNNENVPALPWGEDTTEDTHRPEQHKERAWMC